jgi:hypothetical protein
LSPQATAATRITGDRRRIDICWQYPHVR